MRRRFEQVGALWGSGSSGVGGRCCSAGQSSLRAYTDSLIVKCHPSAYAPCSLCRRGARAVGCDRPNRVSGARTPAGG